MNAGSDWSVARLGIADVDEISSFLNTTWRAAYGGVSIPAFSPQYLRWVYGGPYQEDNALIGIRVRSHLVAFKALLFRPLLITGVEHRSHLSTHLAVAGHLELADKIAVLRTVTELHSFTNSIADEPILRNGPVDTVISYYDEFKGLHRTTESQFAALGVNRARVPFKHWIVNQRQVDKAAAAVELPAATVRLATRADSETLSILFQRRAVTTPVSLAVTAEWIQYHLFSLDRSAVYLAESEGEPSGFVFLYIFDSWRAGSRQTVAVIEFLIVPVPSPSAQALMRAAVDFANRHGARGLVIENATYLDPASSSHTGFVPSTRAMICALGSRTAAIGSCTAFMVDVK